MITMVVTIDEELLRRFDTSLHPDLAAEDISRDSSVDVDVGNTDQQQGEVQ